MKGFFVKTELLPLAGIDSLILISQKETEAKLVILGTELCRIFALGWPNLVHTKTLFIVSVNKYLALSKHLTSVEQFLHLLIGNGFLWTTMAILPVFLRSFANALILYDKKAFVVSQRAKETISGISWI